MKNIKTWILVADGARARIFENNKSKRGLAPALDYDFAHIHSPTRDIGTDKPGRGLGRSTGTHHVMDPKINWHEFEKHLFASSMADVLKKADDSHAFDALVIVAPSKTMGELRKSLTPNVMSKVTAEIGKDLTHLDIHDLGKHLSDVVRI